LFLDDYLIASSTRVHRTVQTARKFERNPVLSPSEKWESPFATIYGSVLRDQGKFKIWYKSGMGVGYAESEDGIIWQKPALDLTIIDGEKSNILFQKKGKTEGSDAFPYMYELFGVHRDDRDPNPISVTKWVSLTSIGNTREAAAIRGTKDSGAGLESPGARMGFIGS